VKKIYSISFILLLLCSCRELTKDDQHLRSLRDLDNDKVKSFLLDELESEYKNPTLYFRLAEVYKNQGQLQQAAINIEQAISLDHDNEEYYKTLIPILIRLEDWTKAEEYSDELITLSPSFYHAYYYLVESCVYSNKMDKAGENLKILSQINAGYLDLPYLKGRYYLAKKDTLDAIHTFNLSLEKRQRVNEIIFMLTDIYIAKHNYKKAKEILSKYNSHPDLDKLNLSILQAKLAEGDKNHELARTHYKKALEYGTNCPATYKLTDYYLSKSQIDSAKYYLEKSTDCQELDRDHYFYNAWLNYRQRNYEEALKSYKIAKELAPEDRTVRWHYRRAYEKIYPPTPVVIDSIQETNNNILPI